MKLASRISLSAPEVDFSLSELRNLAMRRIRAIQKTREIRQMVSELPDFLLLFALCMKSGGSVLATLEYLAQVASGKIATEFQGIISDLKLGGNLVIELELFASRFPSPRIEEFSQSLISNLELGAAISDSLVDQSRSVSDELARNLAKQAAANETKMLIPTIFLILPITVLFAIFPSLAMLSPAI